MQIDDRKLDYAFDPLKGVDVKTLAAVAEDLKKSKDKAKRAIGVFLDRVNRMRTADPAAPESARKTATGPAAKAAGTDACKSSGLRDLRE